MGFFLFLIFVGAILMGVFVASTHKKLTHLSKDLEEARDNVRARQQTAQELLIGIGRTVASFCDYEKPLIKDYLNSIRAAVDSNANHGSLFSLVTSLNFPNSEVAGRVDYNLKEMSRLNEHLYQDVRGYHAARKAFDTTRGVFPAFLFQDSFFELSDDLRLEPEDLKLLPEESTTTAIEKAF